MLGDASRRPAARARRRISTLRERVADLRRRALAVAPIESRLKGSALLGHGGVFDRLDSTLFTLVTSYYLLLFALK